MACVVMVPVSMQDKLVARGKKHILHRPHPPGCLIAQKVYFRQIGGMDGVDFLERSAYQFQHRIPSTVDFLRERGIPCPLFWVANAVDCREIEFHVWR
jgi:hypothetical protein